MCGVFGIIKKGSRDKLVEPVCRAIFAQAHRGPDDEGIEWVSDDPVVALAHRRLAILDLSAAGHQPMRDAQTGNWIVYNGEVFNFRYVREKLRRRGLDFHSESDTEVILKGFGLLGEEAIGDWRGMFALGIWQPRDRRLVLVRDRLGIKPLYYFHKDDTFIFASEIRSLLASRLVPKRISPAALDSYLSFGSVQQPLTIIENIYSVLPGHVLTFQEGQIEQRPYWNLRAGPCSKSAVDHEALSEEIGELLAESVKLRLVSDVPVGVFLSGGIDSTAVTALVRRATNGEIKSFSVCFREQEFSEQKYAEQVARQYGANHHTLLVTEDEILAKLPGALRSMDQPSIDGINTWIVSDTASRAGLKVAMSGLGGDELFAGYKFYRTIARDEQLRAQVNAVPSAIRRAAGVAIGAIATGSRAGKLGALLGSDHLNEHTVQLHRRLFTDAQRRSLCGDALPESSLLSEWNAQQRANCATADPVNQASALELGGYLANTLLRDTDVMSLSHSLEVRVPLIDHKLVERMLAIPGAVKLHGQQTKWLLVRAAGDLPREIVERPKHGFELPFLHWLRSALREQVETAMRKSKLTEVLNADAMQGIWREFLAGRVTWSRAWSFYVLGEWMERNL